MLQTVSRLTAAIAGGYMLTMAASAAIVELLRPPRADAVLAALLISFAIYAGAVLWAFAARTARRAWLGLLLPAGALVAVAGLAMWARPA